MLRRIPLSILCLIPALGLSSEAPLRAQGLNAAQLTQVTVAKKDLRKVNELIASQDYDEAQEALKAVEKDLEDSALPDDAPQVRELRITIETYRKRIDVATGKAKPTIDLKTPSGQKGMRRMMVKPPKPEGPVRFDRDIAPILIGNCLGCHNPKKKSSNLDLSTYATFKKGGDRGPAFEPGNPEESLVVKFLRGIEQPKMPKGQQFLEEDAIERVEDWIKAGASVGEASPTAALTTIIPSEEQVQRERVGKMSDKELASHREQLAEGHWSQVTKKPADVASNETFLVYSSATSASADEILKWVDQSLSEIRARLGGSIRPSKVTSGPVWRGRLTIYVFGDRPGYSEFVRSVEGQADIHPKDLGHYRAGIEEPLIVINDRGQDGDRNLRGLIAETVANAYMTATGGNRLPRWFVVGFSTSLGAKKDPKAKIFKDWKSSAYRKLHDDWKSLAWSVLNDQADWEEDRDLAFSLAEFLESQRRQFTTFIRALNTKGGTADTALKSGFGETRDGLVVAWGEYIKRNYSRIR